MSIGPAGGALVEGGKAQRTGEISRLADFDDGPACDGAVDVGLERIR